MKALGASPGRVVMEVAAEALILGFLGTLVGWSAGILMTMYFMDHPIDLTSIAAEGVRGQGIAFDPYWHSTLDPEWIWIPVAQMVTVSFLAALYPAIKAARHDPVKAMRHT